MGNSLEFYRLSRIVMGGEDRCNNCVGIGYDVHRLVRGRALVLGGIEITHSHGLDGHSDADVLLHAICDAILGALAWGDIGSWFPPDDVKYKGMASSIFAKNIWSKASSEGWKLGNLDSVIIAEAPKLSSHILEIRKSLGNIFNSSSSKISVKATTHERIGSLGRSEGMAAMATVMLIR